MIVHSDNKYDKQNEEAFIPGFWPRHKLSPEVKPSPNPVQSQAWYRQSELTPVTPGSLAGPVFPAAGGNNAMLARCWDLSSQNFKVSSRNNKFQGCTKDSLYLPDSVLLPVQREPSAYSLHLTPAIC